MAGNKTLGEAKRAKQDEFYTQMPDIQAEINAYLHRKNENCRSQTRRVVVKSAAFPHL